MNTESTIFLKDTDINIEDINLVKLEEKETEYLNSYVEITRHIQEINQLFHIYKCNLDNLLFFYKLNNDDILQRNKYIKIAESDSMMINTLVINLISAGKTFVDSIDIFLKSYTNQYALLKKDIISNVYDSCFYYSFLYHMRNFSQHGHLPVQVDVNMCCCFDLEQVLTIPNFKINSKIEEEINKLKKEIYEKFGDHPRIVFSLSIAEYNFCIIRIYMKFLEDIEEIILNYNNKIKYIIKKYPEIIHKGKEVLNGFVLYDIKDSSIHCFDSREKFIDLFWNIKKDISETFVKEKEELESFRKSFRGLKNEK